MTTENTYTVVAKVTLEQYEALMADSVSCQMVMDMDNGHIFYFGENDIPALVQNALLQLLENDDDDKCSEIDSADLDIYFPVVRAWPTEVKAKILELSENFVIRETDFDNDQSVFLGADEEEAQALIGAFPLLRNFFSADLDDMTTWFR